MNLNLASDCLTHVNETTELTFSSIDKAYDQAELMTSIGFEVTAPVSLDGGDTYTFTATR